MQATQVYLPTDGELPKGSDPEVGLVLCFGPADRLEDRTLLASLRARYPLAVVAGCTTAGAIHGGVDDAGMVLTEVRFERTVCRAICAPVVAEDDGYALGSSLAAELLGEDLKHIFVLSDGLAVNGSSLAAGLQAGAGSLVTVSGGLAGDGPRFERTLVMCGEKVAPGRVTAIGFYGPTLRVGLGSRGGWDPIGPRRRVTKSRGNRVLTLDDEPALDLYKRYLGDAAAGLPLSGLRFPLEVQGASGGDALVRTLLAVDEEEHSLIFAGDVPEGSTARLMKANIDRLVEGAATAAQRASQGQTWQVAFLVSCVGRRLVMGQRTEDEVEAVQEVFGNGVSVSGFYGYGELCAGVRGCELHNQTMTVTAFTEV
jgi:hypothetical protein